MRNRETATAIRGSAANDEPEPIPLAREAELREFATTVVKRRARRHDIGAIRPS